MRRVCMVLLAAACACDRGGTHDAITDPGVSGHRWLPLSGTVHDPSAPNATVHCESCHGGNTFAEFDCIGCHGQPSTDPFHAGVAGYVWSSAACYQCHPTGSAAPANHGTAAFPIGAGSAHAGVTCQACHTDLAHPTDPANFACATCHGGLAGFSTQHALAGFEILAQVTDCANGTAVVTAFTPTAADCLRCHADAQVDRVASHPGDNSGFGTAQHRRAGCYTCHQAPRTDKPFGLDFSRSGAAGSSTSSCAVCHARGCGGGG